MRNTIFGFNQRLAVEYGLDLTDLLLLDYVVRANGNPKMRHIVENDISYVWLSHDKIREDLPILDISEGTLRNRISKLKSNDMLTSTLVTCPGFKGSKAYYSITLKTMSLLDDSIEYTTSLKNDTIDQPCHSKMTPNIELDLDTKLDSTTKVVLGDDDTTSSSAKLSSLLAKYNASNDSSFSSKSTKTKNGERGEQPEKPKKKSNLFSKCMDVIDEYAEPNTPLHDALRRYLDLRLEMDKEHRATKGESGKLLYANAWKGIVKHLDNFSDAEVLDVIEQSISRGYLDFYPISKNSIKSSPFSEYGVVVSKKSDDNEEDYSGEDF